MSNQYQETCRFRLTAPLAEQDVDLLSTALSVLVRSVHKHATGQAHVLQMPSAKVTVTDGECVFSVSRLSDETTRAMLEDEA
jgi:hypothetical protein